MILEGSNKITDDFQSFWSQTIGKKNRVELSLEVEFGAASSGPGAGHPSLIFWVRDGTNQLYPQQRSKGVTWFVSFFLQLKSTEGERGKQLFLLDEPGANLHSKAQKDVLRLIETIRENSAIVYTTHSPHLVEHDKLHRIIAVQREGDEPSNPTKLIHSFRLGAASRDTLSPVLAAMGIDMSQQTVIKQDRNVLLEEISAYYYIKAIWKLTDTADEFHFLAATGATNVAAFAQLFLGWGIKFLALLDNDQKGRKVHADLVRDLCGNDQAAALKVAKVLPFEGAIEDLFSPEDYKRYILEQPEIEYQNSNSDFAKRTARMKGIDAIKFKLAVDEGRVSFENLSDFTKERMQNIVTCIRRGATP